MANFGWSLPPGCGPLPGEGGDPPCSVCGLDPGLCICDECPKCGCAGDPECYVSHGMKITEEQIASKKNQESAANFEFTGEPEITETADGSFYAEPDTELPLKTSEAMTERTIEQMCDGITNAVDKWIRSGGASYPELQDVVMNQLTALNLAAIRRDAELYRKIRDGFEPGKRGIRAVLVYANGDQGGFYVGGALDVAVGAMP